MLKLQVRHHLTNALLFEYYSNHIPRTGDSLYHAPSETQYVASTCLHTVAADMDGINISELPIIFVIEASSVQALFDNEPSPTGVVDVSGDQE